MYPWTRNSPLNFVSNLDPESRSGVCIQTPDLDRIHLGGRMRSVTALVRLLMHQCIMDTCDYNRERIHLLSLAKHVMAVTGHSHYQHFPQLNNSMTAWELISIIHFTLHFSKMLVKHCYRPQVC